MSNTFYFIVGTCDVTGHLEFISPNFGQVCEQINPGNVEPKSKYYRIVLPFGGACYCQNFNEVKIHVYLNLYLQFPVE